MKSIVVATLLLSSLSLQSYDHDLFDTHEQELSITLSFSHFMHHFIALLAQENPTDTTVDGLLYSTVQMSQQLMLKRSGMLKEIEESTLFDSFSQPLVDELGKLAAAQARTLVVTKNRQAGAKIDAKQKNDLKKILTCFAGVVQSFFTIVQEPENKQNVTQGLIGMLGNIVIAGNTIIKDTHPNQPINVAANIEQAINEMDENTKQQILSIILSQRRSIRVRS